MINKQVIEIINKMKSNNFHSIYYEKQWENLKESDIINVDKNGLITFSNNFIQENKLKLQLLGYTKYQLLSLVKFPLYPVYFSNDLLAPYLNNPNYNFYWNHYRGSIYSSDENPDNIVLNHISLAYDLKNKKTLIMIFLDDLIGLDKNYQNYMTRFELKDRDYLEVNRFVTENLIYGKRSQVRDSEIYDVILLGMEILNKLFKEKYNIKLFRDIKSLMEYEFFRPIFISSKLNYYLFVLELYKMINDNLSIQSLKNVIKNKSQFEFDNLNDMEKWPKSKIFNVSLGEQNRKYLQHLSDIRNIPAHEIYQNELDDLYLKKQDDLLIKTYKFLNSIITTHYSEEMSFKLLEYSDIFGSMGSLSYGNGFNTSPYVHFDGQKKLISEFFDQRDAEYLIAFKDSRNMNEIMSNYIVSKRPDLNSKIVKYLVDQIINNLALKPDRKHVESFFKGNYYIKSFQNPEMYKGEQYIASGEQIADEFLKKYSLENIFVIADSTDQYFSDFSECQNNNIIVGNGFITELIHYFRLDYKYDNVITNYKEDLEIQIISNIWD